MRGIMTDNSELIERLHDAVTREASGKSALWDALMLEAAKALEATDKENERLRNDILKYRAVMQILIPGSLKKLDETLKNETNS